MCPWCLQLVPALSRLSHKAGVAITLINIFITPTSKINDVNFLSITLC
jgi:protein-disulfide isomerase-like protein with CxxC motif